jgi:hypothetical protein
MDVIFGCTSFLADMGLLAFPGWLVRGNSGRTGDAALSFGITTNDSLAAAAKGRR